METTVIFTFLLAIFYMTLSFPIYVIWRCNTHTDGRCCRCIQIKLRFSGQTHTSGNPLFTVL